jgi:DNA helicase-2/ATP-dependent DNA helicase PcrA
VLVLNVIDGCIPSDMAIGSREQIEEERRLLYVAITRAREHLHLVLFRGHQHRHGDGHVLTMRSRFIPDGILHVLDCRAHGRAVEAPALRMGSPVRVDVSRSRCGRCGIRQRGGRCSTRWIPPVSKTDEAPAVAGYLGDT